jgi:hypothetical protein
MPSRTVVNKNAQSKLLRFYHIVVRHGELIQNRILMFKQCRVFGARALLLKMNDFILELFMNYTPSPLRGTPPLQGESFGKSV